MGYWINIDSTGTSAHRDNIQNFDGIYYNCRPRPDWIHINNVSPNIALRGTCQIEVNERFRRVKPCQTCQPWPIS